MLRARRVEGISEKNAASETQRDELAQELEKERLQELSLTSHMVESAQERFCRSLLEWKSKEISEEALQVRARTPPPKAHAVADACFRPGAAGAGATCDPSRGEGGGHRAVQTAVSV